MGAVVDVFISYKREDKPYAKALAEALARRGLDVWWDVDLLPGERFAAEIEKVVEQAKVAVVLWSERSIQSDYVQDESRLAKDRNILVPARIDASQPPLGFRSLHTEDLTAWDGRPDSPVIAGLVDAVARRAGVSPTPTATDAETESRLHGRDEEARIWESVRTRHPPSLAEYQLYLDRYPAGLFADLARLRLKELARPERPGPMKVVAGATAVVVLVGGVFGVITQWPEVLEVIRPPTADRPADGEQLATPSPPTMEADDTATENLGEDTAAPPTPGTEPDQVEADRASSSRVEELADFAVFTDTLADGSPCGFCPELVAIPGDTFTMGSPRGEGDADEHPQREVRVGRFALGRTEVTVGQFRAFVEASGHDAGSCNYPANASWRDPGFEQTDEHPVACVSWKDADAYVGWLSEQTGEAYRLPSEAEWEFAARAGTKTRYAFGDEITATQANFNSNVSKTTEVGAYPANDWKLFDMHGNVWEWVEDCQHGSYDEAPRDGSAWLEANGGNCSRRVLRGGSWLDNPRYLRSADRDWDSSVFRFRSLGFRVARTLTP